MMLVLRATATEFVPNVVQPSVSPPVFSTTPMPDMHVPVLSSAPFYGFQADAQASARQNNKINGLIANYRKLCCHLLLNSVGRGCRFTNK